VIVALLYKPLEKLKSISAEQLATVFEIYTVCQDILNIVNEFKSILKSKKEAAFSLDKKSCLSRC